MFVTLVVQMYRKLTYTFGLLVGLLLATSGFTQVAKHANSALANGNATNLVQLFSTQVDLTLLDQDDLFTKAEAKTLLINFFEKNVPSSFEELHTGESATGLKYVIGKLTTSTGTYRVSFYYKADGSTELIQQLMIDNE